jgi:DNA-binding MarR family transcriptional regulator
MVPTDPLAQAAFIMSTGKMLRDRTLRLQSCHVEREASRVKFSELTMAQSLAIMAVKENEPMSVNELSSHLSVSAPSASAMVDRLVDRHLLTRETDPTDRRKVMIRLSPEAADDYNNIYNVIFQDFLNLVHKVGPETARKWCEVLVEVKKVIVTEPLAKPQPSDIKGDEK